MAYHHGDLKKALLDAAVAAVEAGGAEALSLRKLSEQVGVTPNAVYRHFSSREDLLLAVGDLGFSRLADAFEATSDCDMDSLGRAYIQYGLQHPWLYRLMFSGRMTSVPRAEDRSFVILQEAVRARAGSEVTERHVLQESINAWAYVHGMVMLLLDGVVELDEIAFSF